ncbi:MAG: RIP metalloprotease RseP, partial [Candidatus Zixiibacteriota bacterium]
LIPLGGYVKMAGENPDETATGAPDEFMSKTKLQRTAVVLAGPMMNYVLAIFLLIGIYLFAGEPYFDNDRVVVGELVEDAPAAAAGMQVGDQIIAINGETVLTFDSVQARINRIVEAPVEITWVRNSDTVTANMVTLSAQQLNMEGGTDTVGQIGFSQQLAGYRHYGVGEAFTKGFVTTHVILYETVRFIKRVVTGDISTKLLGGPVFIARQSGKEARRGAASLFFFMALLSVNLGVLNVLPIPILDGGHLVFLGIEAVRGKPLSMKARLIALQIGMVSLLSLILFVTYNDIVRAFGGLG